MVLLQDVLRPLNPVRVFEQSDDVTSAGLMDGRMKPSKGADVNHSVVAGKLDESVR